MLERVFSLCIFQRGRAGGRGSAGVRGFGIPFGAVLLTYFSLMGILGEKESCLACDEKHNDIWLKAVDGVDAAPSTDPHGCLAHCDWVKLLVGRAG